LEGTGIPGRPEIKWDTSASGLCCREITRTLTVASKEVGVEVKTWKTEYMLLCCRQNAKKNQDIKANKSSEYVAQFKYLE
jgi:hypothetical protein